MNNMMEWLRRMFLSAVNYFWRTDSAHCWESNQCQMVHVKCRNNIYPRSDVKRLKVPDDKCDWNVRFGGYKPPSYTSSSVFGKPWADEDYEKEFSSETVPWNAVDESLKVDRRSFTGTYRINKCGLPKNPMGRTGLKGRGLLGRWGPNHAGDPIVTRWKRDEDNQKVVNTISRKPVLQFVSIQRKDSKEWAIPGGMVDPGEVITETLKREFAEETMNSLEKSASEREASLALVNDTFQNGVEIYKGYVDDPRNTDNAWMETVAYNFHDEKGNIFTMNLHAGDDAVGVTWMDIDRDINLYASHNKFVEEVVKLRQAHW